MSATKSEPMRERELRDAAKCMNCGQKILGAGIPLFWRLTIERFGVDFGALRRQAGMETMMGGSVALAMVMGPDEDMAKPVMDKTTVTLCDACGDKSVRIGLLASMGVAEDQPEPVSEQGEVKHEHT